MSIKIGELRNLYLDHEDETIPGEPELQPAREPDFDPLRRIFLATSSAGPQLSREALLDGLPPKAMSDGLVSRFFDNDDPAIPVSCKIPRCLPSDPELTCDMTRSFSPQHIF